MIEPILQKCWQSHYQIWFGNELLLINLNVLGSLDQANMHNQYHKQVHQSVKKKSNQAYF